MAITDRNLQPGTRLVANYRKTRFVCTVEASEDGKLAFVLEGGKRFNSPSAAGSAVMDGTACNGWRWWTPEGETPVATPRPATKAKTSTKTAGKATTRKARTQKPAARVLQRYDNQEDLSEGETHWVCNACLKHFTVFGKAVPEACPEGHRNDDAELASHPTPEAVAADKAEVTEE